MCDGKICVNQGLQYRNCSKNRQSPILTKTVKTEKSVDFLYKIQNSNFEGKNRKPSDFTDLSFKFFGLSIDFQLFFYLKFNF
jgi:hypothetical protein